MHHERSGSGFERARRVVVALGLALGLQGCGPRPRPSAGASGVGASGGACPADIAARDSAARYACSLHCARSGVAVAGCAGGACLAMPAESARVRLMRYAVPRAGEQFTVNEHGLFVLLADARRALCEAVRGAGDVDLRVRERLGLPVNGNGEQRHLVFLEAPRDALFRPCRASSLAGRCEGAGDGDANAAFFARELGPHLRPESDYNYPFLGTGFTCDWHGGRCEAGESEFVVRGGTAVRVLGECTLEAACGVGDGGVCAF